MEETDLDRLRALYPRWLITSYDVKRSTWLKAVLGSYAVTSPDAATLEAAMAQYESGGVRT